MTSKEDITKNIELIKSGELEEKRAAVTFLSDAGEDAVDALCELLSSETDNDSRWYAASALARIGEPALDSLMLLLKTYPDDNVKRYAAAAVAGIGKPAVKPLIEVFLEDDGPTRGLASRALVRIGEDSVEELNRFISETEPKDTAHRCAVITLEKLCSNAPDAVEEVLEK
ncbi:HEAT repeat domain-containing protein [Methanoplanus sp. FWC-SCC4]|uniref:HEAT repeat domain-containing protein n=1 Tax=Methanochimaera problematica TaxID=2609417 RepID=A0AA97I4X4_9EURY|nr:HEAT repeat domain-containing protein [Methanoplanus sp. FWC-SCC4]WOF16831.1 HEAT repeat domain-containing protein [Methanoplanus sp. FWC-SCC4]